MVTHILHHRCDQWASVNVKSVTKDLPSLKPSSNSVLPIAWIMYKARHGPQTMCQDLNCIVFINTKSKNCICCRMYWLKFPTKLWNTWKGTIYLLVFLMSRLLWSCIIYSSKIHILSSNCDGIFFTHTYIKTKYINDLTPMKKKNCLLCNHPFQLQ